ncbi:MAG: hypothetical protein PUP91_33375 [Rhizonema sp. PD37]|nr:hypothetical protein [Rhizonema sp. PD37]
MKLENIANCLNLEQITADKELVTQIQTKLLGLGLYPGGKFVDGNYGTWTEGAIKNFCNATKLPFRQFDKNFANNLLNLKQLPSILQTDKNQIFQNLLKIDTATQLSENETAAFLNRGIQNSKYFTQIADYPNRLAAKYESPSLPSTYSPYPKRGVIPLIDNQALDFLHSDIQQACVCIGCFVNGQIQTRWLGKNALTLGEFWSATKIIPILNVLSEANKRYYNIDIESCYITNQKFQFLDLVQDIITYQEKITTSNSAAATLKQFRTPEDLELWVKNITQNQQLIFRGKYGEEPFINQPKLIDSKTAQLLIESSLTRHDGQNSVSAYDLTRLVSMVGWHLHIADDSRLPGVQWQSLKSIIKAMGNDRARYVEVALQSLGLENVISSPVIISKLGDGYSEIRKRNEITYVAFVQFVDEHLKMNNQLGKLRTLAMTLRGAMPSTNSQWIELDARMATEVTEIIRLVVMEKLA